MAEEHKDTPAESGENQMSASSIFLEMMRQQAAPPPKPEPAPQSPEAATPDVPEPPPPDEHAAKREQLRIERTKRRRQKRRRSAAGLFGGIFRTLFTVGITATIMATIFTWWQGPQFLSPEVRNDLSIALATATSQGVAVRATALPVTPNWMKRIGIVSGHRGPEDDPGAVCPDGLTEAEINLSVAERVVRNLQARGYTVDLLDEFDPRLADYRANMLLSIHANTCQDFNDASASGYLISTADTRSNSGNDQLLVECVAAYYQNTTKLRRHFGLTRDMTDYHIFRQIHPRTPGAIIELGFMFQDREMLTQQPDLLADGITQGILCYLEPSDANILATMQAPTATPPPSS